MDQPGDPDHPANRGRLCSKGTHLGETIRLEGRLLHPEIDPRQTEIVERADLHLAIAPADLQKFYDLFVDHPRTVTLFSQGVNQSTSGGGRAGDALDLDWQTLVDPASTLAIYMGKAAAGHVSANLIRAGLSPDTQSMVVENASLPNERVVRSRLALLHVATGAAVTDGPALLIIGEAVGRRAPVMKAGSAAMIGKTA